MANQPGYITAFKALARAEVQGHELVENENELYGLNDRATALVFAAVLDVSLEKLLRTVIRDDLSSQEIKAVFSSDKAVFGNFSSKITAAYSLKLIGPASKNDLDLIRLIRNEFAHSRKYFGFSNSETKAVCDQLQIPELEPKVIPYGYVEFCRENKIEIGDLKTPKTRFVSACHGLAYRMWVARGNADIVYGTLEDGPLP